MWWEISLRRDVTVHPRRMEASGRHRRWIIQALLEDMAALQCSSAHGYYVAPTTLSRVSDGFVTDSGSVAYAVEFKCLVFKLVKDEVVEMEVQDVKKCGVEAACGPYDAIFIHHSVMAGFEYADLQGPCFRKGGGGDDRVVSKGCCVRARIMGMQFMGNGFRCLATMNEGHLGPIQPQP